MAHNDADASDTYPRDKTTTEPKDGKYGSKSVDSQGQTVEAPPANTDQV